MSYKVYFFQTARGDYPVKKFTESQDESTYAKIVRMIELVQKYGPYLMGPYVKKLRKDLYELRISGKIAVRILFTCINGCYYLLHAFKKKTQKTPVKEIEIGLDRMKEII